MAIKQITAYRAPGGKLFEQEADALWYDGELSLRESKAVKELWECLAGEKEVTHMMLANILIRNRDEVKKLLEALK